MDHKPSGLLGRAVLLLMLLEIQRSPVFSAPTPTNCKSIVSLAELLKDNTKDLLAAYQQIHGSRSDPIPDEVPDSSISGATISEKLQNIYTKNMLFNMHISKVKEYQETVWGITANSIDERHGRMWNMLSDVETRLGHFLGAVKALLETPSPPTPPPLKLSHTDSYDNKVYGWAVLVTLEKWLSQVLVVCK